MFKTDNKVFWIFESISLLISVVKHTFILNFNNHDRVWKLENEKNATWSDVIDSPSFVRIIRQQHASQVLSPLIVILEVYVENYNKLHY